MIEDKDPAGPLPPAPSTNRKLWAPPRVTRMAAGSAENGPGGTDDGILDS